jgi:hypothetical protein
MATLPFARTLFGVDPAEAALNQQKMWANMYAQAGSPYEKMGLALAQIGGTALGLNETQTDKKIADITKVLNDIGTQYQVGTAEYYKAVADALPPEYADAKAAAQAEFIKFKEKETSVFSASQKAVREDPESVNVYVDPLKINILRKATSKGWSEEEVPVPQTPEELVSFAKKFGLTNDPDFLRANSLYRIADKESKKEAQQEETRLLTIDKIKTQITKNKAELNKIANDNFDAGQRWNAEREAAIALFAASNLDPTKPLRGAALANSELVNAQAKALREPWTGKANVRITPSSAVGAPPAAPAAPRAGGTGGWSATVVQPPKK